MPSSRQQIETWKARLLDLSRRNRLLNVRPGRSGVVTLTHPAAETLFDALVSLCLCRVRLVLSCGFRARMPME